jgi:hypothetical protein
MVDVEHARERLREWAWFHRDRPRKGQAGSAERFWRSPQCWEAPQPRPAFSLLRAIETQGLLQRLPVPNHRALCFRYAYPFLPIGIPLRHLSRRLGYRVNAQVYADLVAIGEHRLAVLIETSPHQPAVLRPGASARVAAVAPARARTSDAASLGVES